MSHGVLMQILWSKSSRINDLCVELNLASALFCYLYDVGHLRFDQQPGVVPKVGSGEKDVVGLLSNVSPRGSSPEWIRPPPPRLPTQNGEVRYILTVSFIVNVFSLEQT